MAGVAVARQSTPGTRTRKVLLLGESALVAPSVPTAKPGLCEALSLTLTARAVAASTSTCCGDSVTP